jgi:hypothetical protein
MFIQTEATPNPASSNSSGKPVLPGSTRDYRSAEEAEESPMAQRLFTVQGVAGVFLGQDFISVTKSSGDWQHLKPAILGLIMDHYLSGAPILLKQAGSQKSTGGEEFFDESDKEIVGTIKELLETRVRPAVAQDGGDITFHGSGRHRLPQHERLVRRLPEFDRHAETRHRKSPAPLRAEATRGQAGLTPVRAAPLRRTMKLLAIDTSMQACSAAIYDAAKAATCASLCSYGSRPG